MTSNTTVQLFWDPPLRHNGIIQFYRVYYKRSTSTKSNSYRSNKTTYGFENLTPYTRYSFWVRAQTSVGPGSKSDTIINRTDEGGKKIISLMQVEKRLFFHKQEYEWISTPIRTVRLRNISHPFF